MMISRKSLGSFSGSAIMTSRIKAAYICLPEDQDVESYIKHCFNTSTVFLRDEFGSTYRNAYISKDLLSQITFPRESNSIGDCVILNIIPKHNQAVVVGILSLKNTPPDITYDDQFRLKKTYGGSLVDFFASAKRSHMTLSVTSSDDNSPRLTTNLTGKKDNALLEEYVKGEAVRHSTRANTIKSNQSTTISVVDDQDGLLGLIEYKRSEGLKITDEFNNEILMRNGNVRIKRGNNYINIDDKISLGDEDSQYKAVLGEVLKGKLDKIIDEIVKITVPTALGPSGVPINSVQLLQLKVEFQEILSNLIKVK